MCVLSPADYSIGIRRVGSDGVTNVLLVVVVSLYSEEV